VVLAVENLHWVDPTSEVLLASLVDGLAGAAILVLATFHPGYRPRWLDKSYATQIALQPLGPDESQQVVGHVVCDTALSLVLEQQLLAKAEGNPFFLEELASKVREQGEGHPALAVPDTIQAVLTARLDRLPIPERQFLQTTAVFGKNVAIPLLQAVTERPEAALQRGLARLQGAEFLYETRLWPDRVYTFKHTLTQEVAYGSLRPERRRALHARIVAALEARTGDRAAEPVDHPSRLMFASWGIGLLFLRQGDLPRAFPLLERALAICQDADLRVWFPGMAEALGAAYTMGGRVTDAVPLLTQAMEREDFQALCCLSLGERQLLAGHLQEARALAERALAHSREHQERGHEAYRPPPPLLP